MDEPEEEPSLSPAALARRLTLELLADESWQAADVTRWFGLHKRVAMVSRKGLPPLKLLRGSRLRKLGRIPRSDEGFAEEALEILRPGHVIVFFSHPWLRPLERKPDSVDNVKAKRLIEFLGPLLDACLLWIDFCCVDQEFPMLEISSLPAYVACASSVVCFESVDVPYETRAWCLVERALSFSFMQEGDKNIVLSEMEEYDEKERDATEERVLLDPSEAGLTDEADREIVEQLKSVVISPIGRVAARVGEMRDGSDVRSIAFNSSVCSVVHSLEPIGKLHDWFVEERLKLEKLPDNEWEELANEWRKEKKRDMALLNVMKLRMESRDGSSRQLQIHSVSQSMLCCFNRPTKSPEEVQNEQISKALGMERQRHENKRREIAKMFVIGPRGAGKSLITHAFRLSVGDGFENIRSAPTSSSIEVETVLKDGVKFEIWQLHSAPKATIADLVEEANLVVVCFSAELKDRHCAEKESFDEAAGAWSMELEAELERYPVAGARGLALFLTFADVVLRNEKAHELARIKFPKDGEKLDEVVLEQLLKDGVQVLSAKAKNEGIYTLLFRGVIDETSRAAFTSMTQSILQKSLEAAGLR